MTSSGNGKFSTGNYKIQRLLIFLFFTAGSVLSQFTSGETYLVEGLQSVLFLCAIVFGAVLVLSASILGIALLPMCAFTFGWLFGGYAGHIAEGFQTGAGLEIKGLLLSCVVIPVFFVVSVQGMCTSEMLGSMLDSYRASARAEYNKAYVPITAAALAGMLFVYFILG